MPTIVSDAALLASHVKWPLFDEYPLVAGISEINYAGVCKYFFDKDIPATHQRRKSSRMAEFLVKDSVSITHLACIVVRDLECGQWASDLLAAYGYSIRVLVKPGCFQ